MTNIKLSEADVTRQVVGFLTTKGWRPLRNNVGGITRGKRFVMHGELGMPDWLFIRYSQYIWSETRPQRGYRAEVLWVEMKAPGKKPSVAQLDWHAAELQWGAVVRVVDNYEEFKTWYEGVFG